MAPLVKMELQEDRSVCVKEEFHYIEGTHLGRGGGGGNRGIGLGGYIE